MQVQNFSTVPLYYVPATPGGTGPANMASRESADDAKRRFEIECEFVQALANPHYLNCKLKF